MSKVKTPEIPRKFCSKCNRQVYQTTHTASTYYNDWYMINNKVICIDCWTGYHNTR